MGRIVVGVDGSASAQHALGWTVREARLHGAQLDVVTVCRPDLHVETPWFVPPEDAELEQEAKRVQTEALRALDTNDLEITEHREIGHPARVLLDHAEGANLLVVGSRGLGTLAGAIIGSVSHQVVSHAPCPVAVVPDRAPSVARIVVGVDGSQHALRALRWAWREAETHDASLEAVAVYQWSSMSVGAPWLPPVAVLDPSELKARVGERLERAVTAVTNADARVVRTVMEGPSASSLLSRAKDADLLVVGSRGYGGFRGLLLGSVSHRCISDAPCPVVVVA